MSDPAAREVLNLRRRMPRGRGSVTSAPGAGTSGVIPVSPQEPPAKRTRREGEGSARGKEKETSRITEEEGRVEEQDQESSERIEGTWVHPRDAPWAPEFCHYAGRQIHHADSVSNLGTAFGMLHGCILPRDAKAVQGLTEDITAEIAQALFTVS